MDVINLNGDVITAEEEQANRITVSAASLERLQQGLSGLLRQRQDLADKLRELDVQIARQEGGIQLMQLLVDGEM